MGYITLAVAFLYGVLICLTLGSISGKMHRLLALILLSEIVIADTFFIQVIGNHPSPDPQGGFSILGLIFGSALIAFGVFYHVTQAAKLAKSSPQKQLSVSFSLPKTKRCSNCDKKNEIGSTFCSKCGASLSEKSSAGRDTQRF